MNAVLGPQASNFDFKAVLVAELSVPRVFLKNMNEKKGPKLVYSATLKRKCREHGDTFSARSKVQKTRYA